MRCVKFFLKHWTPNFTPLSFPQSWQALNAKLLLLQQNINLKKRHLFKHRFLSKPSVQRFTTNILTVKNLELITWSTDCVAHESKKETEHIFYVKRSIRINHRSKRVGFSNMPFFSENHQRIEGWMFEIHLLRRLLLSTFPYSTWQNAQNVFQISPQFSTAAVDHFWNSPAPICIKTLHDTQSGKTTFFTAQWHARWVYWSVDNNTVTTLTMS